MGNDKKDNELLDDVISDNNPFAQEKTDEIESVSDDIIDSSANDEVNSLKTELEKINNQYLRLAADFDNYRKRQAQERESLLKYGAEESLKKMIEVLDNVDRAKKSVENIDDINTLKESYDVVFKQIIEVLGKLGLESIDAEGQEFDPNFHEAVMQTPTSEQPENTVVAVMQKGYKLGDKVLRPALVNVAVAE